MASQAFQEGHKDYREYFRRKKKKHIVWWYYEAIFKMTRPLVERILIKSNGLLLNGFEAWWYLLNSFFGRLGKYVGHGLCYEAAALLMFVFHDNRSARFVYGDCTGEQSGSRIKHSWIEFRAYGIWWVLDITWHFIFLPEPRLIYRLRNRVKYDRIVKYQEFWSWECTRRLFDCMTGAGAGSYVFYELTLFRRSSEDTTETINEHIGNPKPRANLGRRPDYRLIALHSHDNPVSQKVLRHFLLHKKSMQPKARDFRIASAFTEICSRAEAELSRLSEKGDNDGYSISFPTLHTYCLSPLTNAPA